MIESPRAVRVRVTNLDIARQWYCQALECDPSYDDEHGVTFVVGGCLLTLSLGDSSGPPCTTVYWGVDDLAGEYQRLCAMGQHGGQNLPMLDANPRTAEVLDPFGNVFGLFANDEKGERKARNQRVAQKLALQNVRETLDKIQHKEAEEKRLGRIIGWFAAIALMLLVLVVWGVVAKRAPQPGTLLIPLSSTMAN